MVLEQAANHSHTGVLHIQSEELRLDLSQRCHGDYQGVSHEEGAATVETELVMPALATGRHVVKADGQLIAVTPSSPSASPPLLTVLPDCYGRTLAASTALQVINKEMS